MAQEEDESIMNCIQIVDWGKHYENNRTRELKKMAWVPMPNRHDGDGYTRLLDHPNGAAHFGAWCALVEVASRCDIRGTLLGSTGEAIETDSLSRMTRIPTEIWAEVLPRLVTIGWIKEYKIPQEGAGLPQEGAAPAHLVAMNGMERKKEGEGIGAPQATAALESPPLLASPSSEPMMFELQEIHRKATQGAALKLTDGEMSNLLALFRQHDGPSVIAAYRLHQAEKPGKAFCFFLKDFAEYFARAPKPTAPPPVRCAYCQADVDASGKGHTATCNRPGNPNGLTPPDTFDDNFPEASS